MGALYRRSWRAAERGGAARGERGGEWGRALGMSGQTGLRGSILAWAVAAAYAYVLIGVEMASIGPLVERWMHEFSVGTAAVGGVFTASSVGSLAVIVGYPVLVRRLGLRAVLALGALAVGAGLALAAAARAASELVLAFVLVGLGFAGLDLGVNNLYVVLFRERRALALNLVHVFFAVGATVAPLALPLVLRWMSWRAAFASIAVAAAAGSVMLALAGRRSGEPAVPGPGSATGAVKALGGLGGLWLAILVYVGVEVAVTGWAFTFLRQLGASPELSGAAVTVFWAGLAVGRLGLGPLVERTGYEAALRLFASAGGLALVGAAVTPPGMPLMAVALLGAGGVAFAVIFPTIIALASQRVDPARASDVTAFLVLGGTVGSMTVPALAGVAAERWELGGIVGALGVLLAAGFLVLVPVRRGSPEAAGVGAPAACAAGGRVTGKLRQRMGPGSGA